MVGTDYPFAMGEADPLGMLRQTGFDAATIAAISAENPRRFLGLK